ncbi:MAG: hypothetical protein ACYCW6_27735 [Candidatus Xenobia bacterium]
MALKQAAIATAPRPDPVPTPGAIRRLLEQGKARPALDLARQLYAAQPDVHAGTILLECYSERLRKLAPPDREALLEQARARHPGLQQEIERLALTQGRPLDQVLAELLAPDLSEATQEALESFVRTADLVALADCQTLPLDHPVRRAAILLHRALTRVTQGPVGVAELGLEEIPRRSPLAGWKSAVMAIHAFYEGHDELCRRHVEAIDDRSSAVRLRPALRALLGESQTLQTAWESTLVHEVQGRDEAVEDTIRAFERAIENDDQRAARMAARAAVRCCDARHPERTAVLRRHILVRCLTAGNSAPAIEGAIGVVPRDADFWHLLARRMECDHARPEEICYAWYGFLQAATAEKRFGANGAEAAAVQLRMARSLRGTPPWDLKVFQHELADVADYYGAGTVPSNCTFLDAQRLFEASTAADPRPDAFEAWFNASKQDDRLAERVAKQWHQALPKDVRPLLYLAEATAARRGFKQSLQWLDQAERLDPLHPLVRRAVLRSLAGLVCRNLQYRRDTASGVARLRALAQAQEHDLGAFCDMVTWTQHVLHADGTSAQARWLDAEAVLGGPGTELLSQALIKLGKIPGPLRRFMPHPRPAPIRSEIESVARALLLAERVGLSVTVPPNMWPRLEAAMSRANEPLGLSILTAVAEAAILARQQACAFRATVAGLAQGGADARFLLLRAQVLQGRTPGLARRCLQIALALARLERDESLTATIVERLKRGRLQLQENDLRLPADQVMAVLQEERQRTILPTPSQDVARLQKGCTCGNCLDGDDLDVDDIDWDDEDDLDDHDLDAAAVGTLVDMLFGPAEKKRRR